jgi:dTDP-4-dehydrorhamnose reductase
LLADLTALAIDRCQRPETAIPSGLYHLVPSGETTWCRFARFVLAEATRRGLTLRVGSEAVRPIPTSAYPTAAKRPANSRLSTAKLRAALDIELPAWEEGVAAVVAALVD